MIDQYRDMAISVTANLAMNPFYKQIITFMGLTSQKRCHDKRPKIPTACWRLKTLYDFDEAVLTSIWHSTLFTPIITKNSIKIIHEHKVASSLCLNIVKMYVVYVSGCTSYRNASATVEFLAFYSNIPKCNNFS